MRILIPVSASDVHLLPDFTAAHVKMAGLEDHFITFVPTPTVVEQTKIAAATFEKICPNVNVVALTEEPVGDWPSASNNHFAYATRIAATQPDRLPWLWMELDTVGLDGWANKIANAYSNLGNNRSYMGFVQPHLRVVKASGKPGQAPGDDRMSGVAVYPVDMSERREMNALLQDIGYGNRTDGQGFDEYLRHEIKRGNRAHTTLIEDRWNTVNYRVENGNIVCDSGPIDRSPRERGGILNSSAVLIHGCKDGSLHKLVASGKAPRPSSVMAKVAPAENVAVAQEQGGGANDALLKALAGISAQLTNIDARVTAIEKPIVPEPVQTTGEIVLDAQLKEVEFVEIPIENPTPFVPTSNKGTVTASKLVTFINASEKSQTLKMAAAHFNVSYDDVEKIVNTEGSGLILVGPAKWLRIADLVTA
jgi:hypothetical protein